jgi:hypothetical protein
MLVNVIRSVKLEDKIYRAKEYCSVNLDVDGNSSDVKNYLKSGALKKAKIKKVEK